MWDNLTFVQLKPSEKKWLGQLSQNSLLLLFFSEGQIVKLRNYIDIENLDPTRPNFTMDIAWFNDMALPFYNGVGDGFSTDYWRIAIASSVVHTNTINTTTTGTSGSTISYVTSPYGIVPPAPPPLTNSISNIFNSSNEDDNEDEDHEYDNEDEEDDEDTDYTNSTGEAPEAPLFQYNENNHHELTVKYEGCYATKDNQVIKIGEFSSLSANLSTIYYSVIGRDGRYGESKNRTLNEGFSFTLPKLGMINYKDHVVFVQRRHKKSSPSKYRKALRSDTLSFISISPRELALLDKKDIRDMDSYDEAFRLLSYDIFFPNNYSYEDALESVTTFKRLATAFTSTFLIRLDSTTNSIVLQKYEWVIGSYNKKKGLFEMTINTFNEELLELGIPFIETTI